MIISDGTGWGHQTTIWYGYRDSQSFQTAGQPGRLPSIRQPSKQYMLRYNDITAAPPVRLKKVNHRATQSALTTWLSGSPCIFDQNKYLWARDSLPPKTFSRVDQAPNQRLVFTLYGLPSLLTVRSFIVAHSTFPMSTSGVLFHSWFIPLSTLLSNVLL